MKTLQKELLYPPYSEDQLDSLTTTPIRVLPKHAATCASKPQQAKPARVGWHFAANCHLSWIPRPKF